jgi:spore coat protein CotF
MMDKVNAQTRTVMNMVFDKEPINFIECSALYTTIATGRFNLAVLEIMYNHATDPDLRNLVKEAIDDQTRQTVDDAETLINRGGGEQPSQHLKRRELHPQPLNIPSDARLTDREIAAMLGAMARTTQMAVLGALHQCYQLDLAMMYRKRLDAGLDFSYRLMQLMLNHGWLPYIEKVEH